MVVYCVVFGIGIYYMLKLMHKGPQFIYASPEEGVVHSEEAVILASKRPLTSVDESVDSDSKTDNGNEQERK